MSHSIKIITSNLELSKKVIEYFTSQRTNKKLFQLIQKIAIERANKLNKNNIGIIEVGYLSMDDFIHFMATTKQQKLVKISAIQELVKSLSENKILTTLMESLINPNEKRYKASGGGYVEFLYERDLILNLVCGWSFIINKYSNSVIKIEHQHKNGDFSIGTGFYFAAGNKKFVKAMIITNKHVVENAKSLKLYNNEEELIPYNSIISDNKRDLAFIILENRIEQPILNFNPELELLSEIITIGYPSIPMTKQAYQIYHRGEINLVIEDYQDSKLFLFSAKTSSGNSGSPIIDKYGMVIGIVTEELFEKDQFYEKGKLPYYAGIPANEIINSVNENVFI